METILIFAIVFLVLTAIVFYLRHETQHVHDFAKQMRAVVTLREAQEQPYPYVYVNNDGTARELHPSERRYLETPFHPCDGSRPYVKWRYSSRNGWGDLNGYCRRSKIPGQMEFLAAPSEDPTKPLSQKEFTEFMRSKGMKCIQQSDGTFITKAVTR